MQQHMTTVKVLLKQLQTNCYQVFYQSRINLTSLLGYKTIIILNSTEHGICTAHKN